MLNPPSSEIYETKNHHGFSTNDMYESERLKFRRQFLFSPVETKKPDNWIFEKTNSNFLYVHPDCEFSKTTCNKKCLYLIGFAINPHFPEKTTQQVLEDISVFESVNDIPGLLYPLTGRFVLLIEVKEHILIFNDACGLKQVVYSKFDNKLFAASQPLLLEKVIPIKCSAHADIYFNSRYLKYDNEHYLPAGTTLYEDVYQLVPNHYVDSVDFKQKRYWPVTGLSSISVDNAIEKAAVILKNSVYAADKRYNLSLGLTAGRDSRILLSAARKVIDKIYVFTLIYRNLTKHSNDIQIPAKLSSRLGFKHNLINCNKKISEEFAQIYRGNSDMAHWNDWGIIANGMYQNYPDNRIAVRGHCIEIARCDFYRLGFHRKIKSCESFHFHYYGCEMDFIKHRISEWYNEVSEIPVFGYNLYDLFYWEHLLGSWQAQSLLEWDIIHETFAPYNNRELLDLTLSVDLNLRKKPKYMFFGKLAEKMWPETMEEPINPQSFLYKIKNTVKDTLLSVRIKPDVRRFKHILSKNI